MTLDFQRLNFYFNGLLINFLLFMSLKRCLTRLQKFVKLVRLLIHNNIIEKQFARGYFRVKLYEYGIKRDESAQVSEITKWF